MKRILFFCTLLCLITTHIAYAQDSNSKLIQTLLDKKILSEKEAAELLQEVTVENKDKTKENPIESAQKLIRTGFNTPYLNFGGYGMLMYQYSDVEKNHHDLRPRVAFLWLEGKIGNLRYYLMPELVSPTLYEYYAEWMPSTAFNLRGGQFKVPFTLENPISLTQLESVTNTRTVSALAGMGSDIGVNNGGGRDIGVQVSGSLFEQNNHHLVHYWAGVFQGTGINNRENNNTKDLAGTLAIEPIKGLRVAGGLYAGQAVYQVGAGPKTESHVRNRWAVSSDYQAGRFYARAEWVHGNDAGIKREGLYGTALWYLMPKKLNAFVRAEQFYDNKDAKIKAQDYSVGVNYYFAPVCRFQLNYVYSDFSDNWVEKKDANTVFAEMQIVF